MKDTKKYASVVLDLALDKTLDYSIPLELAEKAKPGVRVAVTVRGHLRHGYILSLKDTSDFPKVLPLVKIVSDFELITPELFELALWMAKYYCTPLRQVLKTILPASVRQDMQHKQQLYVMRKKTRDETKEYCEKIRNKFSAQANVLDVMLLVKKGILLTELLEESESSRSSVDALVTKGLLEIDIVRVDRSPLIDEEYFKTKPKKLNEEQAEALRKIHQSMDQKRFETHLLYGVTGSGKTEVYMQAIEKALELGQGTIMLVPEISLTAQTIERFRSRFDDKIAVLHHRLSQGERFDEWHKIRRGESPIVIGARSAIFCPVPKLGLVIVDEEHEPSYKQSDEQPCYNSRDVAVMRGKMGKATVILGSATPSLESYYNASKEKYTLSKLTTRPESVTMPTVHIIDMKPEFEKAKGFTNFSEKLLNAIQKRMETGEQSILFLNRRGYHTTLVCQQCSATIKCEHCDTALTFHLGDNALACHLCGYICSPPPKECPKCHHADPMKYRGVGTELIEKSLLAILPGIRTLRMDADTTKHKGSHQKLLKEFSSGKADVLIGTQMIAKGLHFPSVTLVGVLNSDAGLNIPDFRASENVFQLLTQVSGRAGRGNLPGEVMIQTHLPENATIKHAADCNFENFFEEELAVREMFHYPPFTNMIKIAFSGMDEKKTFECAENVKQWLNQAIGSAFEWHATLPAGHAKIKGRYRFQFLMRGTNIYLVHRAIESLRESVKLPEGIRMKVDVNPSSTFF